MRSVDPSDLLLYAALTAAWSIGGWLAVRTRFRLRRDERLTAGLASGFLGFVVLANLGARFLPLPAACWLAAVAMLALGVGASIRDRSEIRDLLGDLAAWRLPVAFLATVYLFWKIQQGLAIFDEYLHLPLVSVMAAGDIPPHFYLNPELSFAYHYGLHVWAASLVRMADFFPWSAFDLARAFMLALTLALAWLWMRRFTRRLAVAAAGSAVVMLAGGARWALLVLPHAALGWLGTTVQLANTGGNTADFLVQALARPWVIEGGPPMPFPFAFHGGIFVPVVFALSSAGAMPFMTVILLLLLERVRVPGPAAAVVLTLVLASLALSAEHLFVPFDIALAGVLLWKLRRGKPGARLGVWGLALPASALLAAVQGGYITQLMAGLAPGAGAGAGTYNLQGFQLRWPPGLYDAHFGALSLFDLRQLLLLTFELGPALVLVFLLLRRLRGLSLRSWPVRAGLALAALISFLFPFFVEYGVDRSTTRFASTALWIAVVLTLPEIVLGWGRAGRAGKAAASLGLAAMSYGGLVVLSIQLTAMPFQQFTYFVEDLDTEMSARYWNRLEQSGEVLDHLSSRSVTLFGRPSTANSGIYDELPAWVELVKAPFPADAARAGFDYVYFDNSWWRDAGDAVRGAYADPCVVLVDEVVKANLHFRRLFDVSACREAP